jgi:hypothetical protein
VKRASLYRCKCYLCASVTGSFRQDSVQVFPFRHLDVLDYQGTTTASTTRSNPASRIVLTKAHRHKENRDRFHPLSIRQHLNYRGLTQEYRIRRITVPHERIRQDVRTKLLKEVEDIARMTTENQHRLSDHPQAST